MHRSFSSTVFRPPPALHHHNRPNKANVPHKTMLYDYLVGPEPLPIDPINGINGTPLAPKASIPQIKSSVLNNSCESLSSELYSNLGSW